MTLEDVVAVVLFFGITAYALLGGADFGAGFWDLTAGGEKRGEQPRALIDHAIGPVWEANHVWLVFSLVVLWTAFSEAFASITLTLFVPLTIAALGIVLRGSSFAFRKAVFRTRQRRDLGAIFAVSSVLVPYCMGAVAGAIASGRVPAGGIAGDPVDSWINPTSIVGGLLAVAVCAYLSAVYLTREATRLEHPELMEYFRRRAIAASVVAGIVSIAGLIVFDDDSPYLFDGLTSRALPFVVVAVVLGASSLYALVWGRERWARPMAAGAVASIVIAWGVAQWPYLLPTSLKVSQAAAPTGTLQAVVIVVALAAVTILPAFILLWRLDQKGLLPEEGIEADRAPASTG